MRKAKLVEELSLCWPSEAFYPFRQLLPMGEKFWRVYEIGLYFDWFLSICISCLCIRCLVLYIVETPPPVMVDNICNEFMFIHTCIDCGGVCSIYVVGQTSHTFVVFDVSTIGSCSLISIL